MTVPTSTSSIRSSSSWSMHSLGQTWAQIRQPPVRKWTQYSGSIRGTLGTAWRNGTEIAALGPRAISR